MKVLNVAVTSIAVVMVLFTSSKSWAYDYGRLSCEMVGVFAQATFSDKIEGVTKQAALKAIKAKSVEGHVMKDITNAIYSPNSRKLSTPADAYGAFKVLCLQDADLEE